MFRLMKLKQMIFCGSTISCCEFPPKKWSTIFRFPRQVETRGCPRIDACERIDPRGHPRRPSWTSSWIHVELDPIGFDGSNVDPARWIQCRNGNKLCCSSSTKVNRASICSSDIPDEENISPFVPPTTEQGFI